MTTHPLDQSVSHNNAGRVVPGNRPRFSPAAVLLAVILSLPVFSLITIAATGNLDGLDHITGTVLPSAAYTTLFVMIGVGALVACIGTVTAWIVSYLNFPGRGFFQWALMLPLAVPTYISAYAFVEFFSFTGPVQSTVQMLGGFDNARQYWFPDIRTDTGTIVVFGSVLYPYVYLSVRALFHFQGTEVLESAKVLGCSGIRLFFRITLPMARPAIVIGVALALMEVINDIGAVEHLGTNTLTHSIFSVWLNQNDLPGAAQLALILLVFVIGLLLLEHTSRRGRQFHSRSNRNYKVPPARLAVVGWRRAAAVILCSLPLLIGFGIPVYVIGGYAFARIGSGLSPELAEAFGTSVLLGVGGAMITVLIGIYFAYVLRLGKSRLENKLIRLACTGYAVPGTLIALGILIPVAALENSVDALFREYLGFSTGLLVTGTGAVLLYAYAIRFMTISEGTLTNGFLKISPSMDMASRTLGRTRRQTLAEILLPMLNPAIVTAALLVFMEIMKELSATIMLRPFGMSTLSTHVYDLASRARIEEAAVGCLLIMISGIIPVIILLRTPQKP